MVLLTRMVQEEVEPLIIVKDERDKKTLEFEQQKHVKMLARVKERRIFLETLKIEQKPLPDPKVATWDLSKEIKFFDKMMTVLNQRGLRIGMDEVSKRVDEEIRQKITELHARGHILS